jgi:hypothetical protein
MYFLSNYESGKYFTNFLEYSSSYCIQLNTVCDLTKFNHVRVSISSRSAVDINFNNIWEISYMHNYIGKPGSRPHPLKITLWIKTTIRQVFIDWIKIPPDKDHFSIKVTIYLHFRWSLSIGLTVQFNNFH